MAGQELTRKETWQRRETFSVKLARWMATFGEAFNQSVTKERIAIYHQVLGAELTAEQLERACERALRSCRFFPTIAEIRELARHDEKRQVEQETGRDCLDAERAWDELLKYIHRWGADLIPVCHGRAADGQLIMETPEPLTPEIAWAVKQCGGYRCIAEADQEKMHFLREDFLKHYIRHRETAALRAPTREEARRLLGQVKSWQKAIEPGGSERVRDALTVRN